MSLLMGCLFSTSDQISLSCDGLTHSIHNWESSSYQPLIILPAIHDPVYIYRIVLDLVQYEIPVFHIQLVILVYRDIVLVEKRIALGHFLQESQFHQKPLLELNGCGSIYLGKKAQMQP